MADKRTGPGDAARRGKRAAPTIDLKATEVTPAAPEPPQAAAEPHSAPPQEPLAQEPPPVDAETASADERTAAPSKPASFLTAPTLAAGMAGAGMTAILLFALWLTGLVPVRYAGSTATRARVTALEMQLHDLQNKPAAAVDNKAIEALSQRVAKMEDTLAKLPLGDASLNERVAAADNAMKALGLALTALNKRSDDVAVIAAQARERAETTEKAVSDLRASAQDAAKSAGPEISAVELDALQKHLAALEQSAKDARADIGKVTTADIATRRALSAAALRDAVESGAPFSAELAQARSLSGDDKMLAPLAGFAATGVPSAQALAQELRALLPALVKIWDVQPSGNFLERLQANAGRLVRIRPLDAPPGDDAAAVLARLEIEATKADIPAAIADLGKLNNPNLTDATRSPVQQWINKANARQGAIAAARQFAATSVRALGTR